MSTRMKTLYTSEIKKKMMDKYNYGNVHQIPKLEKIVINCVHKEAVSNGKIVDLQLELVKSRLQSSEIELDLTDNAKKLLAKMGYDPVYGARPLKRVIRQLIENQLAQDLLSGKFTTHDQINIDAKDDQMIFNKIT